MGKGKRLFNELELEKQNDSEQYGGKETKSSSPTESIFA
jgi:hypothetical protein